MKGKTGMLLGIFLAVAVLASGCGSKAHSQESDGGASQSEAVKTSQGLQARDAGQLDSAAAGQPGPGTANLPGIPIDAGKAEAVSVYYGSVCYSLFSEDKAMIQKVASLFQGFTLEEAPEGQLDPDTTFQVYFSTDDQQIAAINVDKDSMFYLPDKKKFYKISAGTFHVDQLDQIYNDSMHAQGFDEGQCLIK